jgi:hypothetical protein
MKIILCAAIIATSFGCASIMHGTTQDVTVMSNPSLAKVTVDGLNVGRTPVVAHLSRSANHVMSIELEGFEPYQTALTKEVSGWFWGNILFGGLVGIAIDALDGGMYALTPEQLQAEMVQNPPPAPAAVSKADGGIAIFITLEKKPGWTLVAQLDRK